MDIEKALQIIIDEAERSIENTEGVSMAKNEALSLCKQLMSLFQIWTKILALNPPILHPKDSQNESEEAFGIVLNEAEISALGERSDYHFAVIKATEVLRSFIKNMDIILKIMRRKNTKCYRLKDICMIVGKQVFL